MNRILFAISAFFLLGAFLILESNKRVLADNRAVQVRERPTGSISCNEQGGVTLSNIDITQPRLQNASYVISMDKNFPALIYVDGGICMDLMP